MELRIEILNPKAKKILQNLAELNLISIKESGTPKQSIKKVLSNLRKQADIAPSMDEISKEVNIVRRKRYGSKKT
ncbi:hypothetical protein BMS3Abin03_01298 [bacterium BMS3Abin03]|nr:hypothetical protein BMS3Abin03_01298 [bacterium BMS3Abin03]